MKTVKTRAGRNFRILTADDAPRAEGMMDSCDALFPPELRMAAIANLAGVLVSLGLTKQQQLVALQTLSFQVSLELLRGKQFGAEDMTT